MGGQQGSRRGSRRRRHGSASRLAICERTTRLGEPGVRARARVDDLAAWLHLSATDSETAIGAAAALMLARFGHLASTSRVDVGHDRAGTRGPVRAFRAKQVPARLRRDARADTKPGLAL